MISKVSIKSVGQNLEVQVEGDNPEETVTEYHNILKMLARIQKEERP